MAFFKKVLEGYNACQWTFFKKKEIQTPTAEPTNLFVKSNSKKYTLEFPIVSPKELFSIFFLQ